jgi:hypothetical protein
VSLKSPCVGGLVTSLRCYGEVVEPLGSGSWREEVKVMRDVPLKGISGPQSFVLPLSFCSLAPMRQMDLLCHNDYATTGPWMETSETVSQNKPFLLFKLVFSGILS